MSQKSITFSDKENKVAITNRKQQATAEDFNEIKSTVNDNANDTEARLQTLQSSINGYPLQGEINVAADFPTLAIVTPGWRYSIGTNVTDNDVTKTNTGQVFLAGVSIVWAADGSWIDLGSNYVTTAQKAKIDLGANFVKHIDLTTAAITPFEGAVVTPTVDGTYTNYGGLERLNELCNFVYEGGAWVKKAITALDYLNLNDFENSIKKNIGSVVISDFVKFYGKVNPADGTTPGSGLYSHYVLDLARHTDVPKMLKAQFAAYNATVGYAFYDISGLFISGGAFSTGEHGQINTIDVPSGAVTFKNSIPTDEDDIVIGFIPDGVILLYEDSLEGRVTSLEESIILNKLGIADKITEVTLIGGLGVNYADGTITTSAALSLYELNIEGYAALDLQIILSGGARGYAFYDSLGVFISGGNPDESEDFLITGEHALIEIPDGAVIIRNNILTSDLGLKTAFEFDYIYPIKDVYYDLFKKMYIKQYPINPDSGITISLPDDIYAVKGRTLQIFWRGCVDAVDYSVFDIFVNCPIGNKYNRYYEVTPGTIGDYSFTVNLRNSVKDNITNKTCTIHVVDAPTNPIALSNVLCVGASATASGYWAAELKRMLTSSGGAPAGIGLSNIAFVGRKSVTVAAGQVDLEATGGWSWSTYITSGVKAIRFTVTGASGLNIEDSYRLNDPVHGWLYFSISEINITAGEGNVRCTYRTDSPSTNTPSITSGSLVRAVGTGIDPLVFTNMVEESFSPFWNETTNEVDFLPYANAYCGGQIDVLITHMGVNEVLWEGVSVDSVMDNVRTFIDAFFVDFPSSKIIVTAIPVIPQNGSLGASYTTSGAINQWGTLLTFQEYNRALEALSKEAVYINKVFFAASNSQVDSENVFPTILKPVNTRAIDTEEIGSNPTHPKEEGSYQVADAAFRVLPVVL